MKTFQWQNSLWAPIALISAGQAQLITEAEATNILRSIQIANIDDVRGYVTLPESVNNTTVSWTSSNPDIISDRPDGNIAIGAVHRPPPGSEAEEVSLTADVDYNNGRLAKDFVLTVQPSVKRAEATRYGMLNFGRSLDGQQIYFASSIGNDATAWKPVDDGAPVLTSTKGMGAVRDPSIVRSPEGDKFFLIATDLEVGSSSAERSRENWREEQTDAGRHIEVWESNDLLNWSEQRHVLIAPETAGPVFAPEAIWDPEIGAYVVYWTSSPAPEKPSRGGRYIPFKTQTLYTTTRDFITFTPAKVMNDRPGQRSFHPVIIRNDEDGMFHRFISECSMAKNTTQLVPCRGRDIYQERASSIFAPEDEWELVAGWITHKAMNTTDARAPLIVKANPGDEGGEGYYMYVEQMRYESPDEPQRQQLQPYWTDDLDSGEWKPIDWTSTPGYLREVRQGSIIPLTTAEHAAWRQAELISLDIIEAPSMTEYSLGESLDTDGLYLEASYSDGVVDRELTEGYGGYTLKGFDSKTTGNKTVTAYYTVANVTSIATFHVVVDEDDGDWCDTA